MKKLFIFGFDGTIADTSPGIIYCMNTTAASMGYAPVDHEAMYGVIGNPLEMGFEKLYGMSEDEIEYATNNYSKLYSLKGREMMSLYEGITESLKQLKEKGCKLAVATQKHRMFISDILSVYSEIGELFDVVCATDVNTNLNKNDLIMQACETLGVSAEDSVFVGDSDVDAEGAEKAGVDFAAVLYGWGFRSREDAEKYNCKAYVESATDIFTKLSNI